MNPPVQIDRPPSSPVHPARQVSRPADRSPRIVKQCSLSPEVFVTANAAGSGRVHEKSFATPDGRSTFLVADRISGDNLRFDELGFGSHPRLRNGFDLVVDCFAKI